MLLAGTVGLPTSGKGSTAFQKLSCSGVPAAPLAESVVSPHALLSNVLAVLVLLLGCSCACMLA